MRTSLNLCIRSERRRKTSGTICESGRCVGRVRCGIGSRSPGTCAGGHRRRAPRRWWACLVGVGGVMAAIGGGAGGGYREGTLIRCVGKPVVGYGGWIGLLQPGMPSRYASTSTDCVTVGAKPGRCRSRCFQKRVESCAGVELRKKTPEVVRRPELGKSGDLDFSLA